MYTIPTETGGVTGCGGGRGVKGEEEGWEEGRTYLTIVGVTLPCK